MPAICFQRHDLCVSHPAARGAGPPRQRRVMALGGARRIACLNFLYVPSSTAPVLPRRLTSGTMCDRHHELSAPPSLPHFSGVRRGGLSQRQYRIHHRPESARLQQVSKAAHGGAIDSFGFLTLPFFLTSCQDEPPMATTGRDAERFCRWLGLHRVLSPRGSLPQAAQRLDCQPSDV